MKKIKLKYPVTEFGETVYEVGLDLPPQEELVFPNHPHKANEAQMAHRRLFGQASAYAVAALADPELRAHYEELARQQGKRPRGVAFSDYMKGNDLLAKR